MVYQWSYNKTAWLSSNTDNGTTIHEKLKEMTGQRTVPNVFIRGNHIGGADDTTKLHEEGKLMNLITPPSENYTYDMIVIGGGSGGLACSKVLLHTVNSFLTDTLVEWICTHCWSPIFFSVSMRWKLLGHEEGQRRGLWVKVTKGLVRLLAKYTSIVQFWSNPGFDNSCKKWHFPWAWRY